MGSLGEMAGGHGTMRRPRPGIATELLPVGLVLCCVAGTFALVLAMHQKTALSRRPAAEKAAAVAALPEPPKPAPEPPAPPPPQVVVTPLPPPPPPEDPTKKAVARLGAQGAEQHRAAEDADRLAASLEKARQAAVADSEKWRHRVALVRAQVDRLVDNASKLEMEADALAMERDALAQERDAAKAAIAKAQASGGGYAVLPNRAADGTWQRPVVIECRNGTAILQPRGLTFNMLDMSPLMGARSSPLVVAVARELMRIQSVTSPDGAPVVPYIYFIIRPDGIRPYYEARARLEPLGIAFGYELVEQDWSIDFPDVDTWEIGAPKADPAKPTPPRDFAWPADRPDGKKGDARDPFLWPRHPAGEVGGSALDPAGPGTSGPGRGPIASAGSGAPGQGTGLPGASSPGGDGGNGGVAGLFDRLKASASGGPGGLGDGRDVSPALESYLRNIQGAGGAGGGVGAAAGNGGKPGTGPGGPALALRPVSPEGLPGFDTVEPGAGGSGGAPGLSLLPGGGRAGTSTNAGGGTGTGTGTSSGTGAAGQGTSIWPSLPGGGTGGLAQSGSGGLAGSGQPGGLNPSGVPSPGFNGLPTGGGRSQAQAQAGSFGVPGAGPSGGSIWGQDGNASAPGGGATGPGKPGTGTASQGATGNAAANGTGSAGGTDGAATAGPPPDPTSGRVRIDPSQLQPEEDDEERPPLPPTGLRLPGQTTSDTPGNAAGGLGQPGSGTGSQGGVGQPGPGIGQPGSGTLQPGLGAGQPASGTGQPGSGAAQPGSSTGQPASSTGQPASGTGQPGSGTGQPASGSSQPGSSAGQPGSGTSQPSSGADSQGGDGQSSAGSGQPSGGVSMPSFILGSPRNNAAMNPPKRKSRSSPFIDPRSVDVPLDLVIACGPDGVVLHPGGYRLTLSSLKRERGLGRDLETIVMNYAMIDPMIHPRPRLKFLVEAGGAETFAEARRQTVLSDLEWPVSIQAAGSPAPQLFPKERF